MCQWIALVRAAELLLDERPLHPRPALAAVLGRVEAAVSPAASASRLTSVDRLVGQAAVEPLGLLLERDQHVLGEAPGPLLDVAGLERGELVEAGVSSDR